jgi:hypothetical protein
MSHNHKEHKKAEAEQQRRKEEKKEIKRREKKEEKKKIQMLETPEQKLARKTVITLSCLLFHEYPIFKSKKAERVSTFFGYTNEDNPFGDSNLHEQFVWRKKIDKEIDLGKIMREPSKHDTKRRRDELVSEIEKVKKRRIEREEEKEEFERLKLEESRLREQELFGDWQKKEEEFHLKQAKVRSKIRIRVLGFSGLE